MWLLLAIIRIVEYMGLPHRDKTEADYATDTHRQIFREAMQFSLGQVVRSKYSCCPCESVANELNVAFSEVKPSVKRIKEFQLA